MLKKLLFSLTLVGLLLGSGSLGFDQTSEASTTSTYFMVGDHDSIDD